MASGAIAGPDDCDQEAMLAEVLGQPRPAPVPVLPRTTATTTEAPKVAAPRPPIQRASKVAAPVTPPPVPVAKDPQPARQEVVQEEAPALAPGPDLGADGSLPMLLLVLGIAAAVVFSGHLERS